MSVDGYRYRASLRKLRQLDRSAGERPFSRYLGAPTLSSTHVRPHELCFFLPPGVRAPGYSLALAGMTETYGCSCYETEFRS